MQPKNTLMSGPQIEDNNSKASDPKRRLQRESAIEVLKLSKR